MTVYIFALQQVSDNFKHAGSLYLLIGLLDLTSLHTTLFFEVAL